MSILLSLQSVGAQTAEQMPDLTAVTTPTEAEINVIDLAIKGGWIMVVLLILSLIAGYIFIQRFLVIRRAKRRPEFHEPHQRLYPRGESQLGFEPLP